MNAPRECTMLTRGKRLEYMGALHDPHFFNKK